MKKFITLKTIIILAVVVFVFFLYTVFVGNKQPGLTIVSTVPIANARNVDLGQTITLNFSQEINPSTLRFESNPEENWEITKTNNTNIVLYHKLAFHPSTTYTINIFLKDSMVYSLVFTTQESQGDVRLIQTIEEKMKIDYPLSKLTPYNQPGYSVVYISPLTFEITLKNPNLTSAEVINEVKSWVAQNGGDTSAHKYVIAP